jgi:exodeoxyribonuclease V alpha subunit
MGIFKIEPLEVISPFAEQLVGLSNPNLDGTERSTLGQIIDYLILQLDTGHSCAKLNMLSQELALPSESIVGLLRKSNLVTELSIPAIDKTNIVQNLKSQNITTMLNSESLQPIISDTQQQIHEMHDSQIQESYKIISNNLNIGNKPFHLVATPDGEYLVYITRYLHYELQISRYLPKLINPVYIKDEFIQRTKVYLTKLSAQQQGLPNQQQHLAIINSLRQQFSIITGGPGTGKTTTVILILFMLYQHYGKSLKVKICAPTGKATARVKESLQNSLNMLSGYGIDEWQQTFNELLNDSSNFGTIHKLLGYIPNQIYFRHSENKPLDAEVLIIDESSMVGLPLFSKLITAIDPKITKHVILLGDKNQLSSVEEGYVFASLVNHFTKINSSAVIELTESKRNVGAVGRIANQILNQQIDSTLETLMTNDNTRLVPCVFKPLLYQTCYGTDGYSYSNYIKFIRDNSEQKTLDNTHTQKLFAHYTQFAVLCLSNKGTFGTYNLNVQIEQQVKLQIGVNNTWYSGRPIIITENDQNLGLYNGDIGICQLINNKLLIIFNNGKSYIPEILPPYKLAFAITIHKSQGSEFDSVAIVLKPDDNKSIINDNFLVKELIYTAVTRARNKVIIYSGQHQLKHALSQNTIRHSGLEYFLN